MGKTAKMARAARLLHNAEGDGYLATTGGTRVTEADQKRKLSEAPPAAATDACTGGPASLDGDENGDNGDKPSNSGKGLSAGAPTSYQLVAVDQAGVKKSQDCLDTEESTPIGSACRNRRMASIPVVSMFSHEGSVPVLL